MTHRGLQFRAQQMLVPQKQLCESVSLAFKYRIVPFLICLFEKGTRTQVDHRPCSQPVHNVLGAIGKEDLKTASTESLGGGWQLQRPNRENKKRHATRKLNVICMVLSIFL